MRTKTLLGDIGLAFEDAVTDGNITAEQADRLELIIAEYFAEHWQDDDSPSAEKTFGVCHA